MFYVSFKLYLQDCKTMHVHGSHPFAPFISFDAQVVSVNLGWDMARLKQGFTPLIEILLGSLPEMIWHWTGIRTYVPLSEFLGPYHCNCRRLVSYLVLSQCSLGIATDGGWKKTSVVQCRSRKALVPVEKRNPSCKSYKIGSSELTHFFLENQISFWNRKLENKWWKSHVSHVPPFFCLWKMVNISCFTNHPRTDPQGMSAPNLRSNPIRLPNGIGWKATLGTGARRTFDLRSE